MRVLLPIVGLLTVPFVAQEARDTRSENVAGADSAPQAACLDLGDHDAGEGLIERVVANLNRIVTGSLGPLADWRPQPYEEMVPIPAGTFEMGRHVGSGDPTEPPSELPVHTVNLDAFFMDVYEVTNAKYAAYLNTANWQGRVTVSSGVVYQVGGAAEALCDTTTSSIYSRITWNGSDFGVTAGKEDHPMVMVSWYGCCAYANQRSREDWLTPCYDETTWSCEFNVSGYRLPTEAEWEYAARGGQYDPYTRYPWGNTIDGSMANYRYSGDPFEAAGLWFSTTPVGYYDGGQIPSGVDMANGFGLYDTAGNVWEWCWDWFGSYPSSPATNPTGPATGSERVDRSGCLLYPPSELRTAVRASAPPAVRGLSLGFRVAAARQ